jgi:hypothetical protein
MDRPQPPEGGPFEIEVEQRPGELGVAIAKARIGASM